MQWKYPNAKGIESGAKAGVDIFLHIWNLNSHLGKPPAVKADLPRIAQTLAKELSSLIEGLCKLIILVDMLVRCEAVPSTR